MKRTLTLPFPYLLIGKLLVLGTLFFTSACRERQPVEPSAPAVSVQAARSWYAAQAGRIGTGSLRRHGGGGRAARTGPVVEPEWERARTLAGADGRPYLLVPVQSDTAYRLDGIGTRSLVVRPDGAGGFEARTVELIASPEYRARKRGLVEPHDFTGDILFYELGEGRLVAVGRAADGRTEEMHEVWRQDDSEPNRRSARTVEKCSTYTWNEYVPEGRQGGQTVTPIAGTNQAQTSVEPAASPPGGGQAQKWVVKTWFITVCHQVTVPEGPAVYAAQNPQAYYAPPAAAPYGGYAPPAGASAPPAPQWVVDAERERVKNAGMATWRAKLQSDKLAFLPPCPGLTDAWKPLVEFKAPKEVVDRLKNLTTSEKKTVFGPSDCPNCYGGDEWTIQTLENANGAAVNLDFFPIKIDKLPSINGKQVTASEFLEYIRLNLNHGVDENRSSFMPHPSISGESQRWLSSPLASIVSIRIPGRQILGILGDDGSVIVSKHRPESWMFTTIHDPYNQNHPVSGNRQFGYTQNSDGSYIFYTRGADRITVKIDELLGLVLNEFNGKPLQFTEADELWKSFQKGIADFTNKNGGKANIQPPVINRPDWEQVQAAIKNNVSLSKLNCK